MQVDGKVVALVVNVDPSYRGFRPRGMKHTFGNQSPQRSQGCTNG
jgi:hypothetical protein